MERFTFTNKRGNKIVIGYDDKYILREYEGLTAAEILPSITQSYKQNGYTLHHMAMGTRIISIRYLVCCNDMETTYKERRLMAQIFNPLLGAGVLVYENDAIKMAIDCIVSAQPEPVERMGRLQEYEVELTAYNPFWRDTAESGLLMAGFTGGLSFPVILDGETKFAEKSSITTINNIGDVPAAIRAEFSGECQNPILINATTGEFIQVNTTLQEGEKLTINTAYGNKSVKHIAADGTIQDAYHLISVDSTFFELQTGTNRITFTSDTGTPEVFLYYYNWYVGV